VRRLHAEAGNVNNALSVFRLNKGSKNTLADSSLALSDYLSPEAQIDKAIAAHSAWRGRLTEIVKTRKTDIPVHAIRVDDQCAFGKWLHSEALPHDIRQSGRFQSIKALHAKFHGCAGDVAKMACNGQGGEAAFELGENGAFQQVSTELVGELQSWKQELSAEA
jgi:hypothetical protein